MLRRDDKVSQVLERDALLLAAPDIATRAIDALITAGQAAREQIHYQRALEHFQATAALADRKRDPLEWARVQYGIALLLSDLDRTREEEPVLREVLGVLTSALGAEHPSVRSSRNNLANSWLNQGELKAAD